jgi:hypothetical protein
MRLDRSWITKYQGLCDLIFRPLNDNNDMSNVGNRPSNWDEEFADPNKQE